jgi:hypothetical protein
VEQGVEDQEMEQQELLIQVEVVEETVDHQVQQVQEEPAVRES